MILLDHRQHSFGKAPAKFMLVCTLPQEILIFSLSGSVACIDHNPLMVISHGQLRSWLDYNSSTNITNDFSSVLGRFWKPSTRRSDANGPGVLVKTPLIKDGYYRIDVRLIK